MYTVIDIDGTIARRNAKHFMEVCNVRLKLQIGDERLSTLNYRSFFDQPEVGALRHRIGEERFRLALRWLALDPEVQARLLPVHGALTGVAKLAAASTGLAYYTARRTTFSEKHNTQMEQATYAWLRRYLFPSAGNVVFCLSPLEKLQRLATLALTTTSSLLLVDDRYEQLLSDFSNLDVEHAEALRSTLTLVAFRATRTCLGDVFPVRVVALPTWEHIDEVLRVGCFP